MSFSSPVSLNPIIFYLQRYKVGDGKYIVEPEYYTFHFPFSINLFFSLSKHVCYIIISMRNFRLDISISVSYFTVKPGGRQFHQYLVIGFHWVMEAVAGKV